jgi:hypothetical protein
MSSKLIDEARAAGEREDTKPLAAKIPAEPGWRVVTSTPQGEPQPDGRQDCMVEVRPIGFWGMGPDWLPSPKDWIGGLLGSGRSPRLIPLDPDGKRYPSATIEGIEPPGRDSKEVLAEALARLQRMTEAYLQGGVMGAMLESVK